MITLPLMILAIENNDDRAYITDLYLKYRKLMYSVAIEIVRDPHIAEDMVASAITEMIEKIDTLRKLIVAECVHISPLLLGTTPLTMSVSEIVKGSICKDILYVKAAYAYGSSIADQGG